MEINMVIHDCPTCHITFATTERFDVRMRECHNNFVCPAGHYLQYPGVTIEKRLRDKISALEAELVIAKKKRRTRAKRG